MGKRHEACLSVSDKLDRACVFWKQDRRQEMMKWVDSEESNMVLRFTPTRGAGRETREDIMIDGKRAFVFQAWLRVAAAFAEECDILRVIPQRPDGQKVLWRSYNHNLGIITKRTSRREHDCTEQQQLEHLPLSNKSS